MVAYLATPLAGGVAQAPSLNSMVLNGNVDLFDLTGGEVEGVMQGASNMMKNMLRGVSGSKTVRATIEGLLLCLQGFTNAAHFSSQFGSFLVVGTEILDFSSQGWVLLLFYCVVDG